MMTKRRFGAGLVLVQSFMIASSEGAFDQNVISVAGEKMGIVKAWGLEIADNRAEGDSLYDSPASQELLLHGLRFDLARVQIMPDCFSEDNLGDANSGYCEASLIRMISMLVASNHSEYFTVGATPPRFFRKYYANAGVVDGNANPLLEEKEESYINGLVRIFRLIKSKGLPLPRAHIIQNHVDVNGTYRSCKMTKAQFLRIASHLRQCLDLEGLKSIQILPPDISQGSNYTKYNDVIHQDKGTLPYEGVIVGGYTSPVPFPPFPLLRKQDSQIASELDGGIWQTGFGNLSASDEQAEIVDAARSIVREFSNYSTDTWIWRTGYSCARTPDTLVWGDGQATTAYDFMAVLWKLAPPGTEVYRLNFDFSGESDRDHLYEEVFGIAFKGVRNYCLIVGGLDSRYSRWHLRLRTTPMPMRIYVSKFSESGVERMPVDSAEGIACGSLALIEVPIEK